MSTVLAASGLPIAKSRVCPFNAIEAVDCIGAGGVQARLVVPMATASGWAGKMKHAAPPSVAQVSTSASGMVSTGASGLAGCAVSPHAASAAEARNEQARKVFMASTLCNE